ncbi:heterokaryon incompatibility protein-domain-containing protein [Lophiotrema nucula]|uniref:Heterokaryon incompatibility protein-domain-containing protein n=1 Tax=Lophiotrema nucula TaxID=690887 RepID=A0A6A5Z4C3_9PLEO|nr:heterokaryon incompatibility protein-domain-containing protein [Lophiotrema nucula]
MRLLRLEGDCELSLVEVVSNIPRYAILSHTWGPDHEEVTFKDIKKGTGKSKAGYAKVRLRVHFCRKQAAKDNLRYFWVDTCCIDKSSSSELSEAINSMFRWYQNAERCYVYLPDVMPALGRWFTRGWTLQELIAPASVEFFSEEETPIGDKLSLELTLREVTGIAIEALRGKPLHQFSVDERMSWATDRQTKREEDAAYCLLGIFDIHMPLLYGEGRKKSLMRLQREIEQSHRDETGIDAKSENFLDPTLGQKPAICG